jgi:hypothetical protein
VNDSYHWPQVGRHPRADEWATSRPLYAPLRDLPACQGDACSSGDLPCPTPQHCRLVAPAPAEAATDVGAGLGERDEQHPMLDGAGVVLAIIISLGLYGIGALAWLAWHA